MGESKRIIIVSGHFYPTQTPRAFRATELAKGLANKGFKVIVYTIKQNIDYSPFTLKHKIEVKALGEKYLGYDEKTGGPKRNLVSRILKKVFHKIIEYPEIELMFKTLDVLKKEKDICCLITIVRPYPTHWGAALFTAYYKNRNDNWKWIADCGDPYMGVKTVWHPFYMKYVEKFWCKHADFITVPIEGATSAYYPEFRNKIKVIPQGFDFSYVEIEEYKKNSIPFFIYAGAFYFDKGKRNPIKFLDYLVHLKEDYRFYIYTVTPEILKYEALSNGRIVVNKYVDRLILIKEMSKMDFLVNFSNKSSSQLPSKLIDYALSKRPILDLSSEFTEDEKLTFNNFINGDYRDQLTVSLKNHNINNVVSRFEELF